jgi:hypothetical protein
MSEGIDLSSWKVALNGAEPVHAETIKRDHPSNNGSFGQWRRHRETNTNAQPLLHRKIPPNAIEPDVFANAQIADTELDGILITSST